MLGGPQVQAGVALWEAVTFSRRGLTRHWQQELVSHHPYSPPGGGGLRVQAPYFDQSYGTHGSTILSILTANSPVNQVVVALGWLPRPKQYMQICLPCSSFRSLFCFFRVCACAMVFPNPRPHTLIQMEVEQYQAFLPWYMI
jgi:hypothetical protein